MTELIQSSEEACFLRFQLADEHYALPIENVSSVIQTGEITPIPNTADYLLGLANLRGRTLPIFDLRLMLNLPPAHSDEEKPVLVCLNEQGQVGFVVDHVSEVTHVGLSNISSHMDSLSANIESVATGIFEISGELVTLLAFEKLFGGVA